MNTLTLSPFALRAAIEIYALWEEAHNRFPLDRTLQHEMRTRTFLHSRERRGVSEVLYHAVRFRRRNLLLLESLALPTTSENQIRLAACLLAEEATELALPISAEALATALSHLPERDQPAAFLRETLSFPDTMAKALETQLGEGAIAEGEALNSPAPTVFRVNTLRFSRETLLRRLGSGEKTPYSPWGVVWAKREPVSNLPGFREGGFEVQEEASQLIALLTEARAGQTVVDVGAGAGGKTLALAAMMQNRGRIFALDSSAERMKDFPKRLQRAGIGNTASYLVNCDEEGHWLPDNATLVKLQGRADCVLVDAPCSGSGVLRRAPDTKWRDSASHAADFTPLQRVLLEEASRLVKPDGRLCYAVCAFEPVQGEQVIEEFLASPAGADFSKESLPESLQAFQSKGYFRSWAHQHGTDAFFAARLKRTS